MKNETIIKSLITGIAILLTAMVIGNAIKNRNVAEDTISVVGLGTRDFESDEIYWSGGYSVKAGTAKEAFDAINRDKEKVKAFFLSKGFTEAEFSFSGVNFSKSYRNIVLETNGETTKTESIFDGYIASQSVNFSSKKNPTLMKKIEEVIDKTAELINSGIEFEGNSVQYLYSDLPSLKHNLIENAIRPLALGRKNYLFAGSHEAAQTIGYYYTIFGTCKMQGVNPYEYMVWFLKNIAATKISEIGNISPMAYKNLQENENM